MKLDHLAVACRTLDEGAAHVARALGLEPGLGGQHARMGTWNRLLSLGPEEYLEVVAIDPAAPPVGRPRWFALDDFDGPPRLANWIVARPDLTTVLDGAGEELAFTRGDLSWRMAVPPDGRLPFDGLQPAEIAWDGPHPAPRLPDRGCRLVGLRLVHPAAAALRTRLSALDDPRIEIVEGEAPAMRAEIETPDGVKVLE